MDHTVEDDDFNDDLVKDVFEVERCIREEEKEDLALVADE